MASALLSGRHSEEPRVVVTKGNTDRTKFDGAQSTGFVGLFLVTCFGETESHLRPAQNQDRRLRYTYDVIARNYDVKREFRGLRELRPCGSSGEACTWAPCDRDNPLPGGWPGRLWDPTGGCLH